MVNKAIARPNQIWVYDFVATPADLPANSSIRGEIGTPSTPPTAAQIGTGRQLGALIAKDLVEDIQAMGLSGCAGWAWIVAAGRRRCNPRLSVSVEGGGAVGRFVIGFGSGTSEMDT